jgi:hypothetical protein
MFFFRDIPFFLDIIFLPQSKCLIYPLIFYSFFIPICLEGVFGKYLFYSNSPTIFSVFEEREEEDRGQDEAHAQARMRRRWLRHSRDRAKPTGSVWGRV